MGEIVWIVGVGFRSGAVEKSRMLCSIAIGAVVPPPGVQWPIAACSGGQAASAAGGAAGAAP